MPLIIALSRSFTSCLYLPPPTHQLSIFSFLFEVIIASWDTFMTFILLGTSLPSLSLSHHPSLFLLITLAVLSVDTLQTCGSLS